MPHTRIDNQGWEGECEQRRVERLLMLALLREEQSEGWSRAELERELPDMLPADIQGALEALTSQEVVRLEGQRAYLSASARHLDGLGVICI
jgi:hypothetical protein